MKVTIIVPVYNTEKELKSTLASLINQTYSDIEILIINDGSTDNSEKIIYEYKEKTDKIVYIKKENTGIADTRNLGISKATGDYILFVDSDDYISVELIEKLRKYMEQNIDIIKFKLQRVDENQTILEKVDGAIFDKVNGQEAFNKLYCTDVLLDSPCVYLYKRDYLLKNNFKFKVGTYHEDFGLIPLIVVNADSVVSVDYYGYYYVQSSNSITRNENYEKTVKKMRDSLIQYDNMLQQIKTYNLEKITEENIKIYYTNAIILKLKELNKKDQYIFIKEIKQRKMFSNIKMRNTKQLIKKVILLLNVRWYLKIK